MGNRAVYRRSEGDEWGDTYMFYEKAEKYWKRGNELAEGKPSLNISRSLRMGMFEAFQGRSASFSPVFTSIQGVE